MPADPKSAEPEIRVTMLIQAYHPHVGGAERQLMSLTPLLRRRGVDVRVLTRAMPGAARRETLAEASVSRIAAPGPKAIASLAFTAGAAAAIGAWRPDVIHAHELLSPTTTALLSKRLYRTPIVAKVLRGGALGDIAKLRRTRNGRRRLAAAARDVDAFVVISEEIDRELEALGVPSHRRHFVPNGVDVHLFGPSAAERATVRARMGVGRDVPVAVYCGRLAHEKRVLDLVRLWTNTRANATAQPIVDGLAGHGKREAEDDAELWVVGDGPLFDDIRRAAGPSVRVLGPTDRVYEVLKAADVFVLPSDTEGLSNAMLEAMASELPVVATSVGAAVDLLAHGRGGILVPPGNIGGVLEAVFGLLGHRDRRRELGAQGRSLVRDAYALDTTADGLVALYDSLRRGAPRRAVDDRSRPREETAES